MSGGRSSVLAVVLIVAAACSGSNGPSPTTTPPPPTTTPAPTPTATPSGTPTWQPIAAAPIEGRISAGAVWSGSEMIVWGGVSHPAPPRSPEAVSDGAAYDPATDTWRTLAAPPSGVFGDVGKASAWTGSAAVFWAGNSPDGPAAGAVYDPAKDSWRKLPEGPLGARESYSAVWTGTELAIIGGTSGDAFASPVAAAVDPRTGGWRELGALNDLEALIPHGAVWDGGRIYLTATRSLCPEQGSSCERSRALFLAYDPATDGIRTIDLGASPVPKREWQLLSPVAWTGHDVLLMKGDGSLISYGPSSDAWRTDAASPCPETSVPFSQSAWIGDRYVVPCGDDALELYDPGTDSWTTIQAGPSPLNTDAGGSVVWTGTDLIAWSGIGKKLRSPAEVDGARITLGS